MGARASIVRPGSRVPYVPGAALVVRKVAAGTGFAEDMRVGEDVDFVWRLAAAGWRVRYEPTATRRHQHRVRMRAWFARRKDYGTSAAVLEVRHPGTVRPLYLSGWTALAWLAAASGRPAAGATLTGVGITLLARRLAQVTGEDWPRPGGRTAWRLAARLAGGGTLAAGRPLGSAISRTWWPVAIPAAVAAPAGCASAHAAAAGLAGPSAAPRRGALRGRGCSTTWGTASECGRAARSTGPSGRCYPGWEAVT
jgi:hypothetical protein